jgi:hypothetical protein
MARFVPSGVFRLLDFLICRSPRLCVAGLRSFLPWLMPAVNQSWPMRNPGTRGSSVQRWRALDRPALTACRGYAIGCDSAAQQPGAKNHVRHDQLIP